MFEDTKGVIRIRKSKKDKQHNGQKKKDKQRNGQKKKTKRTNNDLQNVHIKLKTLPLKSDITVNYKITI